jgi:hypothetical protein
MAKSGLHEAAKKSFRGWGLVILAGVLLTILATIDGPRASTVPAATGSTGCQLRVTAAELRVRAGPSTASEQVDTLPEGAVVDGTRVVTDGFRELTGNRWAADQFLTPVPGTTCT